jgi:protease-4
MLKRLRQLTRWFTPGRAFRFIWHNLNNWRRKRYRNLDYITFFVPEMIPALPEERNWIRRRVLGNPPISLLEIDRLFERMGEDPRPKGIILYLRGLRLSLADLQTLRGSLLRLRQKGKRVVCYAQDYDNSTYYLASAADEIILQPGGSLMTIGLISQPTFLKNALDTLGVQLDVVAISPYKGAYDPYSRENISPEGQEQINWLLDSRYQIMLEGIAEGRRISLEDVKNLIDTAPHLDNAALVQHYVDAVLNEEALPAHLGVEHIVPLAKAAPILLRKWRKRSEKSIALLPLSGLIMPGRSAEPPGGIPIPVPFIGEKRLGDLTVIQPARNLMHNERIGAVILWIDSPGGSAAASEAMAAALEELAKKHLVIAYMNSVAASGGYYISSSAGWVVAQPGTITGSIGVILGKPITHGLIENLKVKRLEFTRGANATIFSDRMPFTDAQRRQMRQGIERSYEQFVGRVAKSRNMTVAAVDAVGSGRVWTGRQAQTHRLVDELGDLHTALAKAREIAKLPDHTPITIIQDEGEPLGPQVMKKVNPAALLRYMTDNFRLIASGKAQFLMPIRWDE